MGLAMVRAGAAVAVTAALLTCTAAAEAQRPASLGTGAPSGQSGIQLYNFSGYLGNGQGDPNPPAPTTVNGRLERVFQFLQANGLREATIIPWLGEHGGYCDCEVLANVEEEWSQ